jgi:hypothetical protein
MGTRDVLNDGLQFNGEPEAKIEIVIGTDPGSINGIVAEPSGQRLPSANATVVLAPDGAARHRFNAYKTAISDAAGRFQIPAVPPGDYTVFAWEDIEDGIWQDPSFMSRYEKRGVRIHVGEGARESVTISALPALYP